MQLNRFVDQPLRLFPSPAYGDAPRKVRHVGPDAIAFLLENNAVQRHFSELTAFLGAGAGAKKMRTWGMRSKEPGLPVVLTEPENELLARGSGDSWPSSGTAQSE